jgi:hypothetical protein
VKINIVLGEIELPHFFLVTTRASMAFILFNFLYSNYNNLKYEVYF